MNVPSFGIGRSPQKLKNIANYTVSNWKFIQAIEHNFFSSPQNCSIAALYVYLTLRRGINFEEGWISWCDEALALLASWQDT